VEIAMFNDLRHAARMLLHAKGWTAVVVICLALGIGANTALFGAVNSLLLKELSVPEAGSLVRLRHHGPNDMSTDNSDYGFSKRDAAGQNVRATFSYPMYRTFLASNQTMTDLVATAPAGRVNVMVSGEAELAGAAVASGNYFEMLRVRANPGRVFTADDDRAGASPVAVISQGFWRARFGSAADIVGKAITVNTVPVTIVGVLEAGYTGIQQAVQTPADIVFPIALDAQISGQESRLDKPTYWWLQVMGRLKPGVTPAQVEGNLGEVFRQSAKAGLDAYLQAAPESERNNSRNRSRAEIPALMVDPGSRGIYDANSSDTRIVGVLGGVVALVLLLVCANVANLLLSRSAARQKEVSVRLSLGATRWRLMRQLLTESVLLAVLGSALGLIIGKWAQRLLPGTLGQATPMDWRMLGFLAAITGVTAIVFGTMPALRATAVNVNDALKQTSRSVIGARSLLGRSLLILQVAISLVLLIGAGLFLRTVQNLRGVDVGFNAQNLVIFRVSPPSNRFDQKRAEALNRDIRDRLAAVPGIREVAASQPALLSGSVNSTSMYIQGQTQEQTSINRLVVTPGFLEMMQIPVLLGRTLTERDSDGAPKVVVINEAAARKYFPNENPIGRHFGSSVETSGQQEIVGVVRDAKYNSVRDEAPPTMYVTHLQYRMAGPSFVARTEGEPMSVVGSIRTAMRAIDPAMPVTNVTTQMEQIEGRILQERLFAQAYALFGALALIVAAVGLFGLMSYSVARRTNEIGVRMALGAKPQDVLQLVLGESMTLVLIGIALGVGAALAAGRLVASLLFGVQTTDVMTMALAVIVLSAVAAVAGYLPARRAARVDPMVALHDE
jgi:predicted permease